jgi:hypothetical protein
MKQYGRRASFSHQVGGLQVQGKGFTHTLLSSSVLVNGLSNLMEE